MQCFAELVHTVVSEIGIALAAPSVKLMAFQNPDVLAGMFKIMWQLHRVSTHVCQRGGHVEFESTACFWTLQLEVNLHCNMSSPVRHTQVLLSSKAILLISRLGVLSPAELSTNHDALLLQQQICCSLLDPMLEVAEASFCTHDVAVEASKLWKRLT